MSIITNVIPELHPIGSINKKELARHDLDEIETKYRKLLDNAPDFSRVWLNIVDNEDIPDVESAYERLNDLEEWWTEIVDAVGDIRQAWSIMEGNLGFLFNDAQKKVNLWKEVK